MTEDDFAPFASGFWSTWRLAARRRPPKDEAEEICRGYFYALARYALSDVLEALQRCLRVSRSFPKIAALIHELPPLPSAPPRQGTIDAQRWMSADEIADHARAAALRYQDDPCTCVECVAYSVADQPRRFVPNDVGDSVERAWNADRQRLETVGRWIHGEALARWYAARTGFYASAGPRFRRVLQLVGAEAGQEG